MKQILTRHPKPLFALTILVWVVAWLPLRAQDTTARQQEASQVLDAVVIRRQKAPSAALSQAPVQVLDMERMERSGALLLSDALRQMAGVTLRDYGGIGGMKTVSARGLGSQFSTLTIDGVAVNDCQNGQVDLGRYMLGNSAFISLSNGQQEEMLLSARATAAGSVINMETREPVFFPGERTHGQLSLEGGSFGLWAPSLLLEQRLSRRLSLSLWANYIQSRGDYPFTLYYTTSHRDSASVERREHSAMHLATVDLNLFYRAAPNRTLTGKVHYVNGFHQLPGPVQYYATRGSEQTHEGLFFAQVKHLATFGKWRWQAVGKYQHTTDRYEDSNANSLTRYLYCDYRQQEGYLSAAVEWRPLQGLSASVATDGALTTLNSSLSRNSHVVRRTSLSTVALQYRNGRFEVKGNLLATLVGEDASDIARTIHYNKVSPYAGVSVRPLKGSALRLRYFYKETYRVPNFNEMYYFVIPYDTLRPECAHQHNVGLTLPVVTRYGRDSLSHRTYTFTLDGYHNSVTDKIIAIPRQSMFYWSTMNLGRVDITGLDVSGIFEWQGQRTSLSATLTYSLQHAVNHTDPNDPKSYGHQIPYTPRHSGSLTLYGQTPYINLGLSCMVVGERYYKQQNKEGTRLPPYADLGLTLDRTFALSLGDLRVQVQVLNLLDVQYEVVRSYPMMGRNFRLKLSYTF
ncbi:MAG: TonB-dependent receptor plug domain-containing protein [Bacteroidales bacterium]|nr:TonB-dependent receptor plug domain-containing protein [Bacteroidales bacterium]